MKFIKSARLWSIIAACIATIGVAINYSDGHMRFEGNDCKWIIMVAVLSFIFGEAIKRKNKRLIICSRNIFFLGFFVFCTWICSVCAKLSRWHESVNSVAF